MRPTSESNPERLTDPRLGTVIGGRYRIDELLDQGAMGQVYRAEHVHMRKRVAVKILRRELTRVPEALARFEREAMAAANISHQHVAAATDFGKLDDQSVYLVLEYVEGRTLRTELAQGGFSVRRALSIAGQIAEALAAAHALDIVHRDLKPENVMLVERGTEPDYVKVLDFGVAKVPIEITETAHRESESLITKAGMIFGTPDYMSPEQALGQAVDYRADLYSLGVVLFEMLTGVRPFRSDHELGVLGQQLSAGTPSFAQRVPGVQVPSKVEALVRSLMTNEASGRLKNAVVARDEISLLLRTLVETPPPSPPTGGVPDDFVALGPSSSTARELSSPRLGSFRSGTERQLGGGRRWTSSFTELLARAVAAATALKNKLPEPVSLLPLWAVVMVPAVFLTGAAALVSALTAPRDLVEPNSTPVFAESSAARSEVTESQLEAARRSGHLAMAALRERFPTEAPILLAYAQALVDAEKFEAAARQIEVLLEQSPEYSGRGEVAGVLWETAQADESARLTSKLLRGPMGTKGADITYDLAITPSVQPRVAKSATKWLKTRAFAKISSKEASVAAALLLARSCRVRSELVKRAENAGDQRSLVLLRRFAAGEGCGAHEPAPCNECLLGSAELRTAIAKLASASK